MLKVSKLVYFFATLISTAAVTSSEAKVLLSNTNSQTVLVFKDAEALSQFNRLADSVSHDESLLSRLLTCKVPQGSNIEVLGSGYRTAFVRVIDGSATGCEGTVPIETVKVQ